MRVYLIRGAAAASLALVPLNVVHAQTPLPPIVVEGQAPTETTPSGDSSGVEQTTAGPVDGYRALTATSATKTQTPIEQIPQSIQVIPRSVIEDQQAITVEEALRNVSGVQGNERLSTPTFDATTVRGFGAEQWLDGIPVYYAPGDRNSTANIERIEVLKGPNALLYGDGVGAPPGGAVNVVSKLPEATRGGEFGVTVGSYNYVTPYFDINEPLNASGTALFRITGQYSYGESFIDVIETETYNLHPTLTLTDKKDTSLTVQGRFSRWEQPEYQGLPAVGTVAGDFNIDRELFIGPDNIPDSYSEVRSVTATLDHRFDPVWSFNMKARYSESEFEEFAQTIVGADSFQANLPIVPDTSFWGLVNANLFQELEEVTINPNLLAQFSLGPTKNKFLFGADYTRVTDDGFLFDSFSDGTFFGDTNLFDPIFPPFQTPLAGFSQANEYTTSGVYAQLQTSVWDRVHLLGGLRQARLQIDSSTSSAFGDSEEKADTVRLLPRAGIVVDVLPGLSPFVSYSEGLTGAPGIFYAPGVTPEPIESAQIEGGVKLKLGGGLSGTLAVFEIERSNTPVSVGGGLSAPLGEERSRGFEADLIWQPNANWQVIASYAYIDAELTKEIPATPFSAAIPAGNKLNAVPEHSGRLWVNYAFDSAMLRGWSVGAGIYAASEQFIDLDNLFKSDPTFIVDAKIGYEDERYKAALSVKNVFDEDYFIPRSFFGGRVQPAEGRTVYGSFAIKY